MKSLVRISEQIKQEFYENSIENSGESSRVNFNIGKKYEKNFGVHFKSYLTVL